jgi:hypothetical protein
MLSEMIPEFIDKALLPPGASDLRAREAEKPDAWKAVRLFSNNRQGKTSCNSYVRPTLPCFAAASEH